MNRSSSTTHESVIVGQHSSLNGVVALSCGGVGKTFPVFDAGNAWRLLLGASLSGKQIMALDAVSLVVPKGKMVGVLGRNGAGKSTLLRVLAGIYSASSGRIERCGNMSGLFELGGGANRMMDGREYATRSLMLQGIQRADLHKSLEDVHEFSELDDYFDRPIYTYSTGMAARLYFAVATALRHEIYLIDEMLSVGDEHFKAKCWLRIRDRLSQGASGILVTHDWSALLKLCETSHILDHGRLVASGPTDKIVQSYLNLSNPSGTVARFAADNPLSYSAESRQDARFRFSIELLKSVPVALAYSIELLRVGVGWEILLLAHSLLIADRAGRHEVELVIPKLPLAPGDYYFNLFLNSPKSMESSGIGTGYDVRSWTYGNALSLKVQGSPRRSVTIIPITWERREAICP